MLSPLLWGTTAGNLTHVRESAQESYSATPGRRPVLVPTGDLRVARSALISFGGTRKHKTAAAANLLAQTVFRSPVLAGLLHGVNVAQVERGRRLAEEIGRRLDLPQEPRLLIRPGSRPSSLAYVVIGVFDQDGRPRAFGKLDAPVEGKDSAAARESRALEDVHRGGEPPFIAPRVLSSSRWHNADLTLTTVLPENVNRVRLSPAMLGDLVLQICRSGTHEWQAFRGSPFEDAVNSEVEQAFSREPETARILLAVIRGMDTRYELLMGRSHGDLAPWNVGQARGRIVLWDWESSRLATPAGADLVHWHFQIGLARGDHSRGVRRAVRQFLPAGLGLLTSQQRRIVLGAYLAEHLARRINEGHLRGHEGDLAARALKNALLHT